jgi:hypothetical protein
VLTLNCFAQIQVDYVRIIIIIIIIIIILTITTIINRETGMRRRIKTRTRLDDQAFKSQQGQEVLLSSKWSRPVLGPTHPPIQQVTGVLPGSQAAGVK